MRNIALCMELSDFYEHGIARGLVRYAKAKTDWRLYGYGWMFRSLTDIGRWKGDGIIARIEDPQTADRLSRLGLPVVDIAGAYTRPRFRSVTNDDFLTGYQAALHLLGCGFSRFAFLGVARTRWSDLRRNGFEKALKQRGPKGPKVGTGMERDRVPAFEKPLTWWEGEGLLLDERALADFLSSLELPTALFACNDTTGLRATELAGRLGMAVPESLAILGVDNEDILCELSAPSLSSIMLDCESIGFRAAAVLDAILEHDTEGEHAKAAPEGSHISIPPKEVIERESTLTFACEDGLVAKAVSYIRLHSHEGIDVSDVLPVVSASRRSLETRFRSVLGQEPPRGDRPLENQSGQATTPRNEPHARPCGREVGFRRTTAIPYDI